MNGEEKSLMGPPILPQMNLFKRLRSLQNEKEALLQEHHISLETLEIEKTKVVELLNTEDKLLEDVQESMDEALQLRDEEESHKLKLKNDVIVVGQLRTALGMLSTSSKSHHKNLEDLKGNVTNLIQRIVEAKNEHQQTFHQIQEIKGAIHTQTQTLDKTKETYAISMEKEQTLKHEVTQKQNIIKLKKKDKKEEDQNRESKSRMLNELKSNRDYLEVEHEKIKCKLASGNSMIDDIRDELTGQEKTLHSIIGKIETEMTIKHKLFKKSWQTAAARLQHINKKMKMKEDNLHSIQNQMIVAKQSLKDMEEKKNKVEESHTRHVEQLKLVQAKDEDIRGEVSNLQSEVHAMEMHQHESLKTKEQENQHLVKHIDQLQLEVDGKKQTYEKALKEIESLEDHLASLNSKKKKQEKRKKNDQKKEDQLEKKIHALKKSMGQMEKKIKKNELKQETLLEKVNQLKQDLPASTEEGIRTYYKNLEDEASKQIRSPHSRRASSTLSQQPSYLVDTNEEVTIDAFDEDEGEMVVKKKRKLNNSSSKAMMTPKLVSQRVTSPEIVDILSATLDDSPPTHKKKQQPLGKKKRIRRKKENRASKIRSSFRHLIRSSQKRATSSQEMAQDDLSVFDY
mmetsp:Transcript_204/g.354  ORF Transcript_204/g.354 Transcript_204/m.354 type:complete len:625 (-) Transcript_204:40-1914(-)